MVESERSHRRGFLRRSDFFLCFSFRSSSMKISSKSSLSPGRNREPTLSLSSSLSRRFRSNGSMKGQASPMFPTGGKKKGGTFEPPEPSSPKVTCIGQVRVKSKRKHGRKKLRTRSQRRGEVSFRKTEQAQDGGMHHQQPQPQVQECLPHRNQRWVHLPLSICETLRAFGAEINCFSSSSSSSCSWLSEREKVEKRRGRRSIRTSSSCGAVFARWLFALQESEEKGREIGASRRQEERENRGVVHDIEMEIPEEKLEMRKNEIEEEEEDELDEGRNSICIPPKNALLLMRSRSAPFRMSSLANRFWDSPAPQDEDEDDELEQKHQDNMVNVELEEENKEEDMLDTQHRGEGETPENVKVIAVEEEEVAELVAEDVKEMVEKKDERRVSFSTSNWYLEPEEEDSETEEESETHDAALEEEEELSVSSEEDEKRISPGSTTDLQINGQYDDDEEEKVDEEKSQEREPEPEPVPEATSSILPECLLLMMCEPKLSMEVSKETWVCSTDFVRFRHAERKPTLQKSSGGGGGGDESTKKRLSTDSNPIPSQPAAQQQPRQPKQKKQEKQFEVHPARSSCSKVEQSMVKVIEQKLTSGGGYEPFGLKRCKSEPRRNSAKLAPEVCFWNKSKLEPHQPASLGVGATGFGF